MAFIRVVQSIGGVLRITIYAKQSNDKSSYELYVPGSCNIIKLSLHRMEHPVFSGTLQLQKVYEAVFKKFRQTIFHPIIFCKSNGTKFCILSKNRHEQKQRLFLLYDKIEV